MVQVDDKAEVFFDDLGPCPNCGSTLLIDNLDWNMKVGLTDCNRRCYVCDHGWIEEGDRNGD